ncbi:hypothetical protein NDU88_011585 [Pleurodeles waltl]|uniref:Uncharacterized protein n=1 Tax=Pleurodeles waltl TaxID=8319 RepID=A0AAV7S7A4_PLEWA|nr:hypothetical protein NDU88_011585 [Pleurodeles waltl]
MHSLFRGEKNAAHRHDAFGTTETLTHGLARTTQPDFQGEIDATPAVRVKFRRTAPRNDAQPENKQENPRADPGHLVIPATHRRRRSACPKTTHVFPRVKNNDASPCVKGRNRRTHHFSSCRTTHVSLREK